MSRSEQILESLEVPEEYLDIVKDQLYITDEDTKMVLFGPYETKEQAAVDEKKLKKDFPNTDIILGSAIIEFAYDVEEFNDE